MDEGDPVLTADRIPTEHEEQREVVRWFRQTYKGVRIFAIPNGGARSPATAGRLKAEGVSSGVPDLFVPAWAVGGDEAHEGWSGQCGAKGLD